MIDLTFDQQGADVKITFAHTSIFVADATVSDLQRCGRLGLLKGSAITKQIIAIILALAAAVFTTNASMAQSAFLVDPGNGKYLGNLNSNRHDPNSVSNPYGQYGSRYSQDSINNPYDQYGNPYSSKSVDNPYTTTGPKIMPPSYGYGN